MINKITGYKNSQNFNRYNPSFGMMNLHIKLSDGRRITTPCSEKEEIDFIKEVINLIKNNKFRLRGELPEEFAYYPFDLIRQGLFNDRILLKLPKNPDKVNPKLSYIISGENKTYELAQTTVKTSFFYSSLINTFKKHMGIQTNQIEPALKTKIIEFPKKP